MAWRGPRSIYAVVELLKRHLVLLGMAFVCIKNRLPVIAEGCEVRSGCE